MGAGAVGFGAGLEGVDEGLGEADWGFAAGGMVSGVCGWEGRANLEKIWLVDEGVGFEEVEPIVLEVMGGWCTRACDSDDDDDCEEG